MMKTKNVQCIKKLKSETILESLCRICLQEEAYLPIFDYENVENSISKKISSFLPQEIEDIEGYPKFICNSCNNIVETICLFIDKFKESCRILQNSLNLVKNELLREDSNRELSDTELLLDNVKVEFEDGNNEQVNNTQSILDFKIRQSKHNKVTRRKRISKNRKVAKINNIAASVLESVYAWTGEQWCISSVVKEPVIPKKEPKIKVEKLRIIRPIKKKKKAKVEKLCDICGQVMKNQDKLTKHKKFVHFRKSFKCPHEKCSKICTSELYLNRHIKRKHSNEKDFICNICGGRFAFKNELNKHIRLHDKQKYPLKQYSCQYCDKTYKCQKSIVIHERSVHTGDRPAICSVCDSSFFHEDYLKEHMRLHTGETPFKCPICGRGYAQRGNMKSHLRIHRVSELDAITLRKLKPNYLKLLKV